uniref:Uncharacterized protein n=1 Tax=Phlebotomus papatasi TaxID=29031 RepID=A0A1B0D2K3_PHLPP
MITRNIQTRRFYSNSRQFNQNHLVRQDEIPSNTPYPMHSTTTPVPQTSHLPENSRLVNKKLVVCKIFPDDH